MIEQIEGGGTVFTGAGIELYRLAVLRQALKAQLRGFKLTRGAAASTIVKRQFGLKGNTASLLVQIEAMIASMGGAA